MSISEELQELARREAKINKQMDRLCAYNNLRHELCDKLTRAGVMHIRMDYDLVNIETDQATLETLMLAYINHKVDEKLSDYKKHFRSAYLDSTRT